jgi:ectoine hydroxylase-related dioxygenase (phytanoyl-CoA dioxygenase family)
MSHQQDTPTFTAPFLKNISDFTVEDPTNYEEIAGKYDEWGFVCVNNILSEEEQKEAEDLWYGDLLQSIDESGITDPRLKSVVKLVQDGSEHFPKDSLPGLSSKGFASLYGVPQGKFSWKMRTNQKVKKIYEHLHQNTDLCVSMDVPFFTPDPYSKPECLMWSHADQNINVRDSKGEIIGSPNSHQGIIYVWGSDKQGTSNTVVIPKSHKNEYFELLNSIPESNYDGHSGIYISNIPNPTIREKFVKIWKEKARRIPAKAGSLLIFNSKTIHQGYQNGYRLAQTVCWEPKKYRSEEALNRKVQACVMGIATTHWASIGTHHGVSFIKPKPQKYDGKFHHRNIFPLKNIPLECLTEEANSKWKVYRGRKIPTTPIDQLIKLIKPEYMKFL